MRMKHRHTQLSVSDNRWYMSEDTKNCIIMTSDKDIFLDWSKSKIQITVKKIKENKPIKTLLTKSFDISD